MKIFEQKIVVKQTVETVWHKLIDWHTWPSWDTGMESIIFDGPIESGKVGRLKLKNGPTVNLCIDSINVIDLSNRSYTDHFDLLGTIFVFDHKIEIDGHKNGTVSVTFTATASGKTAFIFGNLLLKPMQKNLSEAVANFSDQFANPISTLPGPPQSFH